MNSASRDDQPMGRRDKSLLRYAIAVLAVVLVVVGIFSVQKLMSAKSVLNVGNTDGLQSSFVVSENATSDRDGTVRGIILLGDQSQGEIGYAGGFTDIVIFLDGEVFKSGDDTPDDSSLSEPPVLDQFDMTFVPHVITVAAGQALQLRNSDSTLHNVNGFANLNQPFNIVIQPGDSDNIVLPRAEFVKVACNLHSKMNAWIAVLPNRYFCKVDTDGRFTLNHVPPGLHQLKGWRESSYPPYAPKRVTLEIAVEAGRTTDVILCLPD